MIELYPDQLESLQKIHNGCILCSGVGSGKSIMALAYYHVLNGGKVKQPGSKLWEPMKNPTDLYIITTAQKRDRLEWDDEVIRFHMNTDPNLSIYNHKVVVDSWNNIGKYTDITSAFFIFDEQRVVGYGAWTKSFLKIAKANEWILLSATPGDTWMDYIPVFIANGFYRNKTEFINNHVIYDWRCKNFPKVLGYQNIERLIRLRDRILVEVPFDRGTVRHYETVQVKYDKKLYRDITKNRFNIWTNEPIKNISELCQSWRKIVNSDESRIEAAKDIVQRKHRAIIFYNYDYELDILRNADWGDGVEWAEWNGHHHQDIPQSMDWVYFVQYNAGSEGWNCIKTDTIIFYSQTYSWRMFEQACGRIDRRNTPFTDLYYYTLKSSAPIDIAIANTLKNKKTFNESRYARKLYEKRKNK